MSDQLQVLNVVFTGLGGISTAIGVFLAYKSLNSWKQQKEPEILLNLMNSINNLIKSIRVMIEECEKIDVPVSEEKCTYDIKEKCTYEIINKHFNNNISTNYLALRANLFTYLKIIDESKAKQFMSLLNSISQKFGYIKRQVEKSEYYYSDRIENNDEYQKLNFQDQIIQYAPLDYRQLLCDDPRGEVFEIIDKLIELRKEVEIFYKK